jgi:hypothetical protein
VTISILGKATRSVSDLNNFLARNGCPEYADLYRQAGEEFGVRWDVAIFQSILETGWFKFGNDVKREQNNFAGIGAKGGGDPGESFPSPIVGIRAQLQNLALRSDVKIEKDTILSKYVLKNYDTIAGRHSKNWEDLSGTWATDTGYHLKIYAVMKLFDDTFTGGKDMEDKEVSWFEMNRTNSGTPMVTAYADSTPKYTHQVSTIEELAAWCKNFPSAHNITVADTSKNIPVCDDFDGSKQNEDKPPVPGVLPKLIPFAKQHPCGMKVQGKYPEKFPRGLVVHFTAGRGTAEHTNEYCAGKGYTLMSMDKDGTIVQSVPLDSWGYHSGTVHHEICVGLEIVCAGKLEKKADGTFWSWFGTQIPKENVRYMDGTAEQIDGYYEKYTPEQEASLIHVCKWLHDNGNGIFKYDNVVGHDESCTRAGKKGNKNDPGGALSMSMPAFRELLKKGS